MSRGAEEEPASPAASSATTRGTKTLPLDHEAFIPVLDEAKKRAVPGPQAEARLQRAVAKLMERAQKVAEKREIGGFPTFEPLLVGSAAKDTWLPNQVDLDVFLLFDPALSRAQLEEEGLAAGREILHESTLRYAEHPYVVGPFEGYEADVVPAYKVENGQQIQSSVDRTPFHNLWVQEKIRQDPALTTEIRLMKAWLRGVGVYGAKTALRGISGYLSEVLTIHHGGFLQTLAHAKDFRPGTRIDPSGGGTAGHPEEPLVVVDPVDPTRNAAAAVRTDRLERFAQAAHAFLAGPSMRFFEPAPLVPPRLEIAQEVLRLRGFIAVVFPVPDMREDARDPHLERAAMTLGRQLERIGFDVEKTWGGITKNGRSALAVITKKSRLPRSRLHLGPPTGIQTRSAEFQSKYENHPDTLDAPFEMEWEGRRHLAVRLRERERDLEGRAWKIIDKFSLGKHVDPVIRSDETRVVPLAQALSDPGLAPIVAGFLVARPPWQREGHAVRDYLRAPKDASSHGR